MYSPNGYIAWIILAIKVSVIGLGVCILLNLIFYRKEMIHSKADVSLEPTQMGRYEFNKLSTYSMPMYLFHQQIIYFSITILDGVVNPWINAGVNFIVATVGAYIISAILMKWKITRFLVG